jgi:hypothetical protein
MNSKIIEAIGKLDPVGLDDMSSIRFMSRVDIKYVVPLNKLLDLFKLLNGNYKILDINNIRALPYSTTYFDTSDYLFYIQHVRGKSERYKLRYRIYESSGDSFLEVKKKNLKGRTMKWRICNDFTPGIFDDEALSFMAKHLPVETENLSPSIINSFSRVTLAGLETMERVTLDFDISYRNVRTGKKDGMPYLAIVELKKDGNSISCPFNTIMKSLNSYPTGFSKYVMGLALLDEALKKNMIKRRFIILNKIENEYAHHLGQ